MSVPLSVLFVLRHSGFVRNFESAIEELASRGHSVHLAFELAREQAEVADRLAERNPAVTVGSAPVRTDRWQHLAFDLRAGVDAIRYRGAAYAAAPKLRERGLRGAPGWLRALTAMAPFSRPAVLALLDAVLRRLLAALPPDPTIKRFLDEQAPEVLLVTPLVAGPTQDDVVRAARRRGIPTVLPVTSWDNLTNKGLIREPVDLVIVWNQAQQNEAIEHHSVPPERVVVVGAHSYDHWFGWRASRERTAFCAEVGLPADRPILLYLTSSKFIAPDEPVFVRRWLTELRAGPAPLPDTPVLIRPHPATGEWWRGADLGDVGPVAVWPPVGADPRNAEAKAGYYDSMHHAAAAVGINTSALIELAIIGRPAFTLLDPQFRDSQAGTLHFAHLTDAGGGILTTAATPDEHHRQLIDALNAPREPANRETFLRSFVRPHGLQRPAAPLLADAVETARAVDRAPVHGAVDAALRLMLWPVAPLVTSSGRKSGLPKRLRRWRRRRAKAMARARRRARQAPGRIRDALRR
jgi:hypothetical protein